MKGNQNPLSIITNETKYPTELTVSQLLYSLAEKYHNRPALSYGGKELTYGELNKRSNQLARYLQEKGAVRNTLIAVFTEHSLEMIISLFAVIKAGGTYIPINTKDSAKRQQHILQDSRAEILLTNCNTEFLNAESMILDIVDVTEEDIYQERDENLPCISLPEDILYMIYTSGTTGVPKGVMITHTNLISLFQNEGFQFNFSCEDIWTLFHTYSFDFSAWEIYGALLSGGKLVILSERMKNSYLELTKALHQEKVSILSLVPSVFYGFSDDVNLWKDLSLKYLFLGGEALNPAKLSTIKTVLKQLDIVNLYGITETTVFDMSKVIDEEDIQKGISNIGSPMPGHTIYVIEDGEICNIGVPGELCISGNGVGVGYWKQPELTKEKFIKNPYEKDSVLYRTGDLVCMHEDETIEYLGRLDNQIKIRGYRIELEEIENCAKSLSIVKNFVAAPYETQSGEEVLLTGYAAFHSGNTEEHLKELKQFLKAKLPPYMNPSLWVVMDEIPVTQNGKADRNSLPKPVEGQRKGGQPQNETQKKIHNIWIALLGHENIGIEDSFYESGGHSLLAITLRNQMSKEFHVDLTMSELIQNPTIYGLARLLDGRTKNDQEEKIFEPERKNRYEPFEITDLQQAYYIGRQSSIELGNCATHIYAEMEWESYDHQKMTRIVNRLINRHDMLRCEFDNEGNQKVKEKLEDVKIPFYDITGYSPKGKKAYLKKLRNRLETQILDYHCAPLATLHVTRVEENKTILHLYHDAMIVDGWSHEILISEADQLYQDEKKKLPEIHMTFRDYVQYYNSLKFTSKYRKAKEFWLKELPSLPTNPQLPMVKKPEDIEDVTSVQVKRSFSLSDWKKIEKAAEYMGVSSFVISLTSFCKAIARYSKNQEFIINVPVSYRPDMHEDVEKIVGVCSNYFLFDFHNTAGESLYETAVKVQKRLWELNDNDVFTGTEVVREMYKENGKIGDHIAAIVFTSLVDVPYEERKALRRTFIETHTSQIWIDSVAFRMDSQVSFMWDCVQGLFDPKMLKDMADCFYDCMNYLTKEKNAWEKVSGLSLPDSDRTIIEKVNETKEKYDQRSMNIRLAECEKKYGNHIAVAVSDQDFTYQSVFVEAKKLSSRLLKAGCGQKQGVGILMKKEWRQIVSVIAVLSIGAYYMPLEPEMPQETVAYCLENAGIQIVITDEVNKSRLKEKEVCMINLDEEEDGLSLPAIWPVEDKTEDIVTVIHTSGSTGKPKGIPISQNSLLNAIEFTNRKFSVSEKDKAIALTNLCHDMSMYDVFGMLLAGGTIVIPDDDKVKDPKHWAWLIETKGVTIWNSVPSFMEMLMESKREESAFRLPTLRLLIHGGDFLKPSVAGWESKMAENSRLINVGGPTETTLWSIYHEVSKKDIAGGRIPYGKPISNMQHYILNDNLELCPIGVKGLIYSAGAGVTKGYVNLEEETQKRYLIWKDDKRLFNTGDIGYYLPDGTIQIVGRDDFQIKISGKRIETEGIEQVLSKYDEIRNCVVIPDENLQFLIAYYVSSKTYETKELQKAILKYLPSYMVPKYFVKMDELLLTVNGKVNRKLLPKQFQEETTQVKQIARDTLDKELQDYCCKLLERDDMDIGENFFMAGGNSIAAIKLLSHMNKQYEIEIKLAELLLNPTILIWHDLIMKETAKGNVQKKIKIEDFILQEEKKYPLSSSQTGVWMHHNIYQTPKFTLCAYTQMNGKLDLNVFKEALSHVVSTHDIFGIRFYSDKNKIPFQTYQAGKPDQVYLEQMELEEDKQIMEFIEHESHHVSDLTRSDTYRFTLIKKEEDSYLFVFRMHHLISDAETFDMFMEEFIETYEKALSGVPLPVPSIKNPYLEYCSRQKSTEQEKKYWLKKLQADELYFYEFPDCESGRSEGNERHICFELPKEQIVQLKLLCTKNNTSLFTGLFTVFTIILYHMSGNQKIYITSSFSHRTQEQYSDCFGMFINNLLLGIEMDFEDSFLTVLKKAGREITDSYQYSSMAFDDIIRNLNMDPAFSKLQSHIVFTFIDKERKETNRGGLKFGAMNYVKKEENNVLNIFIEHVKGQYICELNYMDHKVSEETARQIETMFTECLDKCIKDPDMPVLEYVLKEKSDEYLEQELYF